MLRDRYQDLEDFVDFLTEAEKLFSYRVFMTISNSAVILFSSARGYILQTWDMYIRIPLRKQKLLRFLVHKSVPFVLYKILNCYSNLDLIRTFKSALHLQKQKEPQLTVS